MRETRVGLRGAPRFRRVLDGAPGVPHTRGISEHTAAELVQSERLARRWFAVIQSGSLEQLVSLVHDDVVVVSKVRPGHVVEGREAFALHAAGPLSESLYEALAEVYRPLDETRVVVEGRVRWIDEERVIRDDPVVWALEFRDGLLVRFVPARTAVEAETILHSS